MLKDFILNQLTKLEGEIDAINAEILEISNEENGLNKQIGELLAQRDVGMELFSPRSAHHSVRQSIDEIQKHIEELHYKEAEARQRLENTTLEVEKYRELLAEANSKEINGQLAEKLKETIENADEDLPAAVSDQPGVTKDDLETLLEHTDKALDYLYSDRAKCKNELKSIHYFLKALLTDLQ